jgi:hypothetical protein
MEHPAYRISHLGSDWDSMTNRLMKASCQHRVDTREPDTHALGRRLSESCVDTGRTLIEDGQRAKLSLKGQGYWN